MITIYARLMNLFFLVLISFTLLYTQTAKDSMFGDIEALLTEAKEKGAEFLSPVLYGKAVESYNAANEDYMNNASSRDVKEELTKAREYASKAIETVNLAKITLKEAINARDAAYAVEAGEYAKELFNEAEKYFKNATERIEKGNIEDARELGNKAEELYRASELKAIKDNILVDARKVITEAKNRKAAETAPQTFSLANNILLEIEALLKTDRYAAQGAKEKAAECVYQGRHAIYITEKINKLKQEGRNWEKLILEFEDALTSIGNLFGEKLRFDSGWEDAINIILTRVTNLKDEHQELIAENAQLQEEYSKVKEKATTSSEELAKRKEEEAKIAKVKSIFSPSEARVLFDGENLVIRLHGLTFAPGQDVIQPEYFSILTKVQSALNEYPEKHAIIEGHTDSKGVPIVNEKLSEKRAIAVREYLLANMNINRSQITAVGYGDKKPITSNATEEGRRLNRRIDIVINLSKK
jgi:OOP family OmpA-OmpF porin